MSQKRIPVLEDFSWQQPVIQAISNEPAGAVAGDRYLVSSPASGAFTGKENQIAWRDEVNWHFDVPLPGWILFNESMGKYSWFNGTGWRPFSEQFTGNFIKSLQGVVAGKIPTWQASDELGEGYGVAVNPEESSLETKIFRADAIKAYVDNLIGASDAMVFKGTLGVGGTITELPTTYGVGWTYKVITPGEYADKSCEIGDMIIALVDREGTGNLDSDWTVVQSNIDGAVTGPQSAVQGNLPSFHDASGKIIKDSGVSAQAVSEHLANPNIHVPPEQIDHNVIQNIGSYKHSGVDLHINNTSLHRQTNYVPVLGCILWDDASVLPGSEHQN